MLLERRALEVARLCLAPDENVSPVATHVFIDEDGRVAATDGHCLLRVDGTPQEEPTLFMERLEGVDLSEGMAIPGDVVSDFLRAWGGEQVVVNRADGKATLASADGQTSRLFEVAQGPTAPPKFESMLRANPDVTVMLDLKLLQKVLATLKAMGATTVRLGISGAEKPILVHAQARNDRGHEAQVEGVVMPMRG